jgi:hypothetical protein
MTQGFVRIVVGMVCLTTATPIYAQINISSFSGTYTQNFDTLATTGTTNAWANNSTIPGWSLFSQPVTANPPAITTYAAGTGSSGTGAFYSFGVSGQNALEERALGGVASGSTYFGSPAPSSGAVAGWITVAFTNDTASSIASVGVRFDGEQWRNGGNSTPQTMVMEYRKGSTFDPTATWTAPGASFNFISPVATTTAAALDGNLAANRVADIGGTIDLSASPLLNGETLWIRWIENNDTGNDHGLAIDNFRFTPIPEPATIFGAGTVMLGIGAWVRRRLRPHAMS